MEPTFSIKEAFSSGWAIFTKNPWTIAGIVLALLAFSVIVNALTGDRSGALGVIGSIIGLAASTIVNIAFLRMALHAHTDPMHLKFEDLWVPTLILPMLGTIILVSIVTVVGLVLLIVPGLIALSALSVAQILVVDKGLMPVAAMKESYRITKGHWLKILLFMLALAGINIVGLILIGVGLLVTIPVSLFAVVHAYHKLSGLAGTPIKA